MNKKFFPIYLITFINVLSFSLLIPVFPFLIKIYSQPEIVLWLFAASYSFFQFLWAPIMWALSDKFWRKPILLATQFGTFLSWVLLWIAYFVPEINIFGFLLLPIFVIFLSRMFDWITGWNMSVLNAIISDLTTRQERTKVFWINWAIMWIWLIIGPSIWAFSIAGNIWYLWTAIIWAVISLSAFIVLICILKESLKDEDKNHNLEITFKQLNIFNQIKKYWETPNFKMVILFKLFFYCAFMVYTTVSVLYIIDNFWLSEANVWFYMILTWSFLIFHQLFSIKFFSEKFWDIRSSLIWFLSLFIWYLWMWFSSDIYIYTFFYFFSILWVALLFTTLQSILSKSATEKQQWEIMWILTWIESFIAIVIPIAGAYIYQVIDFSIFKIISIFPVLAIISYIIFFRKSRI